MIQIIILLYFFYTLLHYIFIKYETTTENSYINNSKNFITKYNILTIIQYSLIICIFIVTVSVIFLYTFYSISENMIVSFRECIEIYTNRDYGFTFKIANKYPIEYYILFSAYILLGILAIHRSFHILSAIKTNLVIRMIIVTIIANCIQYTTVPTIKAISVANVNQGLTIDELITTINFMVSTLCIYSIVFLLCILFLYFSKNLDKNYSINSSTIFNRSTIVTLLSIFCKIFCSISIFNILISNFYLTTHFFKPEIIELFDKALLTI